MPRRRAVKPPPVLHALESEIMEHLWDRPGASTVREVMEGLNLTARPPRAYTTYMTVMRRLGDKGLLRRTRRGRQDSYLPALTREEYRQRRAGAEVRQLVDEFGDVALAHFARSLSDLDPDRLRALEELARGD